VKCDETRPHCHVCLKAYRHCKWKKPAPKQKRVILPQTFSELGRIQPSETLLFIDSREVYYFRAYQEEVSSELAGVLKSPAWGYTLLQACYHEPFILRAVVAIGALNKSIKTSHLASVGPLASREPNLQIAKSHRAFAIASYDQAIRGMQQIVPAPEDFPAIRKALLASLLIFCMEMFLGSPNVAWCQVQAGYNLLQQWIARSSQESTGISSPDSAAIEDDIFLEVGRLELQHVIKWSVKELPRHSTRRLEGSGTIKVMSSRFSYIGEAKAFQELLLRRTHHLIGETYARIICANRELRQLFTADGPGELVDPCTLPRMLLEERDSYLNDIRQWLCSFAPLLKNLIASSDPLTSSGAALLQLQMLDAEIVLAGAFFTNECDYDQFLPSFSEILSLSSIVASRTNQLSAASPPTFYFIDSFERALSNVAQFCRDKTIRHDALSVLRSITHRDPTSYCARMVTRTSYLVGLEEEGRLPDSTIPESARWRIIYLLHHYKDAQLHLTVICARRIGYPLGLEYPAQREWRRRKFTEAEASSMVVTPWKGEMHYVPWPPKEVLPKPFCVAWKEVHAELTGSTERLRIA
jgi:hypothetical protein